MPPAGLSFKKESRQRKFYERVEGIDSLKAGVIFAKVTHHAAGRPFFLKERRKEPFFSLLWRANYLNWIYLPVLLCLRVATILSTILIDCY